MPKILRILNRLNVGGPTYNVAYLSKYLGSPYQTHVLAGIKEPDEASSEYMLQDLSVPYQFVPNMHRAISPLKDLEAYTYIKQQIDAFQPDIVHTHAAKAGALGRLAAYNAKKRPKAIIHTYHGNVFDGYFSPLKTKLILGIERYLCKISNAIVAISDAQKADLAYKYKIAPAQKIHVIKLGFDLQKFGAAREVKRQAFRQHYHIEDDTVVISITGRLAPVKNHSLFIKAVQIIKQQHPGCKMKCFIVGNGESFDNIVQQIYSTGMTCCLPGEERYGADIIFTSWRKDIDVVNAGSDIVALTSVNEGTPVSIIEALASGKAVVCTDVGGVRDVVENGVSGLLCQQEANDFAINLYSLINNKELRTVLALNGEKKALQNYSFQRLVTDTEKLYSNLLA